MCPEEEQQGILNHFHESACGGHFFFPEDSNEGAAVGFLLAFLVQGSTPNVPLYVTDAKDSGSCLVRNMMPLNPIFSGRIIQCVGASISWDLSPRHMVIHTFWWEWTMSPSGLKQSPARPMDHRVVLKFLKANIFFQVWGTESHY